MLIRSKDDNVNHRFKVTLILRNGITVSGYRYSADKELLENDIEVELCSENPFVSLGGYGGARTSNIIAFTIEFDK